MFKTIIQIWRTGFPMPRSVAVPRLTQAGVIETLFETFDGHLKDQGYLAMGGQIIDASIVAVPKQRNSRKENARIKAGEMPEWQDKPAKRRQKDVEARWTKKHGRSHYGNHVNVDRRHKLVRRYQVSDAATHDSKVLDDMKIQKFWSKVMRAATPQRRPRLVLRTTIKPCDVEARIQSMRFGRSATPRTRTLLAPRPPLVVRATCGPGPRSTATAS